MLNVHRRWGRCPEESSAVQKFILDENQEYLPIPEPRFRLSFDLNQLRARTISPFPTETSLTSYLNPTSVHRWRLSDSVSRGRRQGRHPVVEEQFLRPAERL